MSRLRLHAFLLLHSFSESVRTSPKSAVMPSQFLRPISPMDSRAFGRHSRICRGRSQAFAPVRRRRRVDQMRTFGSAARRRTPDEDAGRPHA